MTGGEIKHILGNSFFEVGSSVQINIKGYDTIKATVQRVEKGRATFLFDDILFERAMISNGIGQREEKHLYQYLNRVLRTALPYTDIRNIGIPCYENLFKKSIQRGNTYYPMKGESLWPLMTSKESRAKGLGYWLRNPTRANNYTPSRCYAAVNGEGALQCVYEGTILGVRPCFDLSF